MLELVQRFGTSMERGAILRGLLDYREALRRAGFAEGLQWIDGSFVEDCEAARGRPPGDVDIVSLLRRPIAVENPANWVTFLNANSAMFDQAAIKAQYHCDAYFIDLNIDPSLVAEQTAYWFGLFSHQRMSFRWKGMVQVPFICDDTSALNELTVRALTW